MGLRLTLFRASGLRPSLTSTPPLSFPPFLARPPRAAFCSLAVRHCSAQLAACSMLRAAAKCVKQDPSQIYPVLPAASVPLDRFLRRLEVLHARCARQARAPAGSPVQRHVLCAHLAQRRLSTGLLSVDCVLLAQLRRESARLRARHAPPGATPRPRAWHRATSALPALCPMLQAARAYPAFPLAPAAVTRASLRVTRAGLWAHRPVEWSSIIPVQAKGSMQLFP